MSRLVAVYLTVGILLGTTVLRTDAVQSSGQAPSEAQSVEVVSPVTASSREADVETTTQKLKLAPADATWTIAGSFIRTELPVDLIRQIQRTDRDDFIFSLADGNVIRGNFSSKIVRFIDRGKDLSISAAQLRSVQLPVVFALLPAGREMVVRSRAGDVLRAVVPEGDLVVRTDSGPLKRPWGDLLSIGFSSGNRVVIETRTGEKLNGVCDPIELKAILGERQLPVRIPLKSLELITFVTREGPGLDAGSLQQPTDARSLVLRVRSDSAWTEISLPGIEWEFVRSEKREGEGLIDQSSLRKAPPSLHISSNDTLVESDIYLKLRGAVPKTAQILIKKSSRGNVRVSINADVRGVVPEWVECQGPAPSEGRSFDIHP